MRWKTHAVPRAGAIVLVAVSAWTCAVDRVGDPPAQRGPGTSASSDPPDASATTPDVPTTNGIDRLPPGPPPSQDCKKTAPFEAPKVLLLLPRGTGVPRLSQDELSLTISVPVPGDGGENADLARTTRPSLDAPFGTVAFLSKLSSPKEDRDPMISADGLLLFFHSTRDDKGAAADLYVATRGSVDKEFGAPVPITALSTPVQEAHAYYRTANSELYFTRNTPDAGREIFRTLRTPSGQYLNTTSISELSSPEDDYQPMVTEDGLTMLFASQRTGTVGNFDLWTSDRDSVESKWGTPKNLTELNTAEAEFAGFLSADRCRVYFSRLGPDKVSVMVASRPRE